MMMMMVKSNDVEAELSEILRCFSTFLRLAFYFLFVVVLALALVIWKLDH